jgi:hypothetical protein
MMNITQMFRFPIGRRFAIGIRQRPHRALRIAARSKPWSIEAKFDFRGGICLWRVEPRPLACTCCAMQAIIRALTARVGGRSVNRDLIGNRSFFKDLGRDCLIVTRCKPFWRITMDRGVLSRPHNHPNFALVHMFGSTPILTRTYQEATYLAELCYEKGSPGLCWVPECPDDMNDAIDFALNRRIAETRECQPLSLQSSVACAQSALPT